MHHPVEAVLWTEPTSRDFAFMAWVDEIRMLAEMITN